MRVLSNLPLECFDDRAAMHGVELVTYGPPDRMLVDGVRFPFDVAFDPSNGTIEQLLAALPQGFTPDVVMLWWPDQEPLPAGLERCPVPVVGVVSDYNLSLPQIAGLWPFFDALLCDRAGVPLFERLTFANVRYWCQYAHKRPFHFVHADAGPRDVDVGFVGNLNPVVQRERAQWLERVRKLADHGVRSEVRTGVSGSDYGRYLSRCRIGWNRSIRGEMNLRAFEVPACGALLLMERGNLEVADFFAPGEECVLHGDDDLEDVVRSLLGDPARLARIAAAGHRRVQQHRLGNRLHEVAAIVAERTQPRPVASAADVAIGRATAMLMTWADGAAIAKAALAAHAQAPEDPRTLNLLGLAAVRARGNDGAADAYRLWRRALQIAPRYVPAATNLGALVASAPDDALARQLRSLRDGQLAAAGWAELDGPTLPLGYGELAVARSLALQAAVRSGDPRPFAQALAR